MTSYDVILPAPMCRLGARFTGDVLTRLDFLPLGTETSGGACNDVRVRRLSTELDAYWSDPTHHIELVHLAEGTAFQKRVWESLRTIPRDAPMTYGGLARRLGSSARAVGQACGANPVPILIPCHRVVAAKGLGGFMHAADGAPLDVKRWLLAHEKAASSR